MRSTAPLLGPAQCPRHSCEQIPWGTVPDQLLLSARQMSLKSQVLVERAGCCILWGPFSRGALIQRSSSRDVERFQ
jgi:hypothetical protein